MSRFSSIYLQSLEFYLLGYARLMRDRLTVIVYAQLCVNESINSFSPTNGRHTFHSRNAWKTCKCALFCRAEDLVTITIRNKNIFSRLQAGGNLFRSGRLWFVNLGLKMAKNCFINATSSSANFHKIQSISALVK